MAYCSKCGCELEENTTICKECRKKNSSTNSNKKTIPPKKPSIIVIATIILAAIIFLFLGIITIPMNEPSITVFMFGAAACMILLIFILYGKNGYVYSYNSIPMEHSNENNELNPIPEDINKTNNNASQKQSNYRKPLYAFLVIIGIMLIVSSPISMNIDFFNKKNIKHISECTNPIDKPLEYDDTYFNVTDLKVKLKNNDIVISGVVHNKMDYRMTAYVYISVFNKNGKRIDYLRGEVGNIAGQNSMEFRFSTTPNCIDDIVYYNLEGVSS